MVVNVVLEEEEEEEEEDEDKDEDDEVGDDDICVLEDVLLGAGVALGIIVTMDGGKVVCPDVKTAHAPDKTTVGI